MDVIDGKMIYPSSGAHKGARNIDYQKPYQAAGLDKSIPWYQASAITISSGWAAPSWTITSERPSSDPTSSISMITCDVL